MQQYVLVLNCGSSSLKFAVIDPQSGDEVCKGLAERLGQQGAAIKVKFAGNTEEAALPAPGSHVEALLYIEEALKRFGLQEALCAVGHRVVHGGEFFSASVKIDAAVRDKIAECIRLAPLHNPAHVIGIDAATKAFPGLPQVAVFDTAFHQKMPEKAFLYALPMSLYKEHHIRRYGFHGTSFRYVAAQMPVLLGKEQPKLIVCHLGNGGSLAAIDGDHSVDTTMGLTPLEGIVHGTRSGDLDPAIPTLLVEQFGMSVAEVDATLWKQSGLLGLSGISNDCRTLEEAMEQGDADAARALEIYCYRLAKHIAAQMVALGGCDALVFTGGIGENSPFVRGRTVAQLAFLGFVVDAAKNAETMRGKAGNVAASGSKPVWVVPTNEELLIARDTAALCGEGA
ncbi:MAG: acetate kinase [Cardiobacteriaceae bacterium]|nr:acetate kinase [Cardiobacteriaceae bacterium]